MQSPGDEMELLMAVNRKYRYLFAQQENMKTFKEYDSIEVILFLYIGVINILRQPFNRSREILFYFSNLIINFGFLISRYSCCQMITVAVRPG